MKMNEYTSYEEARAHFKFSQVWELFDGNEKNFNIAHECIDRHVGTGTAMRIKFEDGHTEEYSFDEISKSSSQFANALESLGVNFGDRVAIMLDPSFEFYVSLFGTLKRGAIVVPCFTLFGPEALKYRLDDSEAKILITTDDKAEIIKGISDISVITSGAQFRRLLEGKNEKFTYNTTAKNVAVYQYTSGTTRRYPEAIKHYHRSIATLMPAAVFGRGLKKGDKYFCPSSPAWGHGLWHGTFSPLALGITTAAYSGKFDTKRLLEALEQFKINNIGAVSTVYRMIKDSGLVGNYHFKIDKITYSGESMDLDTFRFLEDTFGVPPHSGYGSTEGGAVIYNYAGFDNWIVKSGSLGKPLPGLEVKLIDEEGRDVPQGKIGELALKRRGKWFRLKDTAVMDKDGYFWHKGRVDDIIISAGWTISPDEVEDVLIKHSAVREVAVVGVPDQARGQIVMAFVVSNLVPNQELKEELKEFVKDKLSKHEYPRDIEFVGELPKTEIGKIKRKELRETVTNKSVNAFTISNK